MTRSTSTHSYRIDVEWSDAGGTADYRGYTRDHVLTGAADAPIAASADPHFRGDPARWNPEQLLVAAAADCHMLSYLALCALRGVVVIDYVDSAVGTMVETAGVGGRFTGIELAPRVTVAPGTDVDLALRLHGEAATQCYVAASLSCPVDHSPTVVSGSRAAGTGAGPVPTVIRAGSVPAYTPVTRTVSTPAS